MEVKNGVNQILSNYFYQVSYINHDEANISDYRAADLLDRLDEDMAKKLSDVYGYVLADSDIKELKDQYDKQQQAGDMMRAEHDVFDKNH